MSVQSHQQMGYREAAAWGLTAGLTEGRTQFRRIGHGETGAVDEVDAVPLPAGGRVVIEVLAAAAGDRALETAEHAQGQPSAGLAVGGIGEVQAAKVSQLADRDIAMQGLLEQQIGGDGGSELPLPPAVAQVAANRADQAFGQNIGEVVLDAGEGFGQSSHSGLRGVRKGRSHSPFIMTGRPLLLPPPTPKPTPCAEVTIRYTLAVILMAFHNVPFFSTRVMMPVDGKIHFRCPHCDKAVSVAEAHAGKRASALGAARHCKSRPPSRPSTSTRCSTEAWKSCGIKTAAHDGTWQLGKADWDIDQDAGTIVFTSPKGITATCPVQVIGTFNTEDDTWLWGWDHPSVDPGCKNMPGFAATTASGTGSST